MKRILIALTGDDLLDTVIFETLPALISMKCQFDFIHIREKLSDVGYLAPKNMVHVTHENVEYEAFKEVYQQKSITSSLSIPIALKYFLKMYTIPLRFLLTI